MPFSPLVLDAIATEKVNSDNTTVSGMAPFVLRLRQQ